MAVGFFSKGIEFSLPHPPIPERTILLICLVIKRAWQLLVENPTAGFILDLASEDTVTQMLVEIIENRLRKNGEVEGFNNALFGRVVREPKVVNFNKTHPDKMPDIFFDLRRDQYSVLSDQDGLFVECKPVDNKHPIWSCYCQKGLVRFVNGDYAWAMRDAMMVGYATSTHSFKKLASVLDEAKSASLNTHVHFEIDNYSIFRSKHKREFEWLESHGKACQISISHLWLSI